MAEHKNANHESPEEIREPLTLDAPTTPGNLIENNSVTEVQEMTKMASYAASNPVEKFTLG